MILYSLSLPSSNFGVVPHIEDAEKELYAQIETMGMEGVVGKRKDSQYVSRRSKDWLKIINWSYAIAFITGYKQVEFGWNAAVPDPTGRMRPVGIIEHGPSPKHKQAFCGICQQLVTGEDKNHVCLEPRIQDRVKMRNWTKSGLLRIPVFNQFIF